MSESTNTKNNKKLFIGVAALVVAIAAFIGIYFAFRAKPDAGFKTITIEIIDDTQTPTLYETKTEAEFLRQAMEETEGLSFSGTEGEYGLMIDTVNGLRADYAQDNAYWSFYVNDEYCNYGVDTQPVCDGDAFRIVYTPAE